MAGYPAEFIECKNCKGDGGLGISRNCVATYQMCKICNGSGKLLIDKAQFCILIIEEANKIEI